MNNCLLMTRRRLQKGMFAVLGIRELPILVITSPLARFIMLKAHKEDHRGPNVTLWWLRTEAWIVRDLKLALQVERICIFCTKKKKKVMEQQLGDMKGTVLLANHLLVNLSLDLKGV